MKKEEFVKLAEKVYNGSASDEELMLYSMYYNKLHQEEERSEPLNAEVLEERGNSIYRHITYRLAHEARPVLRNKGRRAFVAVSVAASILILAAVGFWFLKPSDVSVNEAKTFVTKVSGSANTLVTLPDGSTVILGAASRLDYPAKFKDARLREVTLVGKGFFDIKHDPSRPFIVHTGEVNTTVLGTAFDIQAYPGTAKVTVRVIRGKVSVSNKKKTLSILDPDKQAVVYNDRKDHAVVTSVNAEEELNWREKDLLFNDVSFAQASRLLEERFDVKISIADSQLAARHFTTTLYEKQELGDFLSLICDFNQATFRVDWKTRRVLIDPVK